MAPLPRMLYAPHRLSSLCVLLLTTAALWTGFSSPARAAAWLPSTQLSPTDGSNGSSIAMQPDGTAVVVWNQRVSPGSYVVASASRTPHGAWTPGSPISTPGAAANTVRLVPAPAGEFVATWLEAGTVMSATRRQTGTWSAPQALSTTTAGLSGLAVGPSGLVVAAWSTLDGVGTRVQTATRTPSGTWSAVDELSGLDVGPHTPAIAIDAADTVTIAWNRYDGTEQGVETTSRPSGGTWEPVTRISTPGEPAQAAQLAASATGALTAAWFATVGGDARIQVASRPNGGAWGAVDTVSSAGRNGSHPRLAPLPNGTTVLAWDDEDGTGNQIYTAVGSSSAWSPPAQLSPPGATASLTSLSAQHDGSARLTWSRTDGPYNQAELSTYTAASGWAEPLALKADGPSSEGTVASDASGNVGVAWRSGPSPSSSIAVTLFDATAPTTSDTVPVAAVSRPVPIGLPSIDPGGSQRVVTTYELIAANGARGSTRTYDAATPPILRNGERLAYRSVDDAGNVERERVSRPLRISLRFRAYSPKQLLLNKRHATLWMRCGEIDCNVRMSGVIYVGSRRIGRITLRHRRVLAGTKVIVRNPTTRRQRQRIRALVRTTGKPAYIRFRLTATAADQRSQRTVRVTLRTLDR